MSNKLRSKWRAILVMTLGLLVLALPLMFLLENFVRDAIVRPASYVWWITSTVINALPRRFFLIVFIIFASSMALRSITRPKATKWAEKAVNREFGGQVALWSQRIGLLTRGTYSRGRFAQHLGHVVVSVLAHDLRISNREVVQQCERGELGIPDSVKQIILLGQRDEEAIAEPLSLLQWIRRIIQRYTRRTEYTSSVVFDQTISDAIDYLETKLGIRESEALPADGLIWEDQYHGNSARS